MFKGSRPDLAALIERQAKRYELESRVTEVPPPPTLPYIAISRDAAVDALPVARAIADRTQFRVLDDELVDEVARSAGVPRDVVLTYDLNPHAQLEQMIADLPFMHLFSEDEYVHHLGAVVRDLAATGRVVLVGHAASMVLPPGSGVRLHLTAPESVRAVWCAITDGVDPYEALTRVRAEDARRRRFYERHFGFAADSPHANDLVMDITAYGQGAIADRVCQLLGERLSKGRGPRAGATADLRQPDAAAPSLLRPEPPR